MGLFRNTQTVDSRKSLTGECMRVYEEPLVFGKQRCWGFFSNSIFIMIMSIGMTLYACGGGGSGTTSIEGPLLSINEIKAMKVDQFYINGGLGDEYVNEGEFSIYLRDAATGKDVACTHIDDGMHRVSLPGMVYANLDIPFREIDADHPSDMARFQIVFVEQDSEGCPGAIDDDDDIAGISDEFMFDDLLEKRIWAKNGRASVVFRSGDAENSRIQSMAPALNTGLFVDKLYFENDRAGDDAGRYYLFADRIEDGESSYQCQVADELMTHIRYSDIVYAALGFAFDCFDFENTDVETTKVRIGLYYQTDNGPELIGETKDVAIGALIGEKIVFTNNKGYISFQSVMTTPFSSSVIRLQELPTLNVNELDYTLMPSQAGRVELHVMDADMKYSLACAMGDYQGISIDESGHYADLQAHFMTTDDQRELFGWDLVKMVLVERMDNLACPLPFDQMPAVLGESTVLSSRVLGTSQRISFENGAGYISLK